MKRIKLTEAQLHRVIKESVRQIINEISKDTVEASREKARKIANDPNVSPERRYKAEAQAERFGIKSREMFDKGETSTNPNGRIKNEKTGKWEEQKPREHTKQSLDTLQQRMRINDEDRTTPIARDENGRPTKYKREYSNGKWRTDVNAQRCPYSKKAKTQQEPEKKGFFGRMFGK